MNNGAPFYYTGSIPALPNVFTNTTIVVSSRVGGYNQLYNILGAPRVQQAIQNEISGGEQGS